MLRHSLGVGQHPGMLQDLQQRQPLVWLFLEQLMMGGSKIHVVDSCMYESVVSFQ